MDKKLRVHFMGIGGSGMAPIAIIAKKMGFAVSGCDVAATGYYSSALADNGINIQVGHDLRHLDHIDVLAITPAILDINPNHPEIIEGRKRNILMTWQQFAGEYLQKDKFVISIAGTHGKSTTTVLMGLVLEVGGLDPIVEAGTVYKPWGGGFRTADSDYFVCEADEFNCNFHHFSPSIAIINNVEMDHPEFFKNFAEVKQAFRNFIKKIKAPKILIVNEESSGLREIVIDLKEWLEQEKVKVIGYYLHDRFDFPFVTEYKGELKSSGTDSLVYSVLSDSVHEQLELGVPGIHNVANSLGVLGAALELGISTDSVKSAFKRFQGIDRRFELIGERGGIKVYDDYAHHPTEIAAGIATCRMSHPGRKLWAIMEPHQISRIKLLFDEFTAALNQADQVIITQPFLGREIHKNIEPLDMELFVKKVDGNKTRYIEKFADVADYIAGNAKPQDIVLVFGAGESYKLARNIVENLGKRD